MNISRSIINVFVCECVCMYIYIYIYKRFECTIINKMFTTSVYIMHLSWLTKNIKIKFWKYIFLEIYQRPLQINFFPCFLLFLKFTLFSFFLRYQCTQEEIFTCKDNIWSSACDEQLVQHENWGLGDEQITLIPICPLGQTGHNLSDCK